MSWARFGTSVAVVALVACGSFGADSGTDGGANAGATCAETCADAGPSCSFHDFEGGCGPDVAFSGDTMMDGVVGVCGGGKLRVAADRTFDITAEVSSGTPGEYKAIRVSARIAVTKWDGKNAFTVELERNTIAEIDVVMAASGRPRFNLCNAGHCAGMGFEANIGEEHLFVLDITSTSVSLSVDCTMLASRPAQIVLTPSTGLAVTFGRIDAEPIDGTIDDVAISYR